MFPEITEIEIEEELLEEQISARKTYLFDFKTGEFVTANGKFVLVEGTDALRLWIEKTIRTERYRFDIYEAEEFGISIEELLGSNYPNEFVEMEIEREVTEALLNHELITEVVEWEFERMGKSATISFKVETELDDVEMEVIL